ncbi:MAG: Sec-independent protein translocase protein TatB [Hyphomicrobiales bacterium]
MFDFGVGYSELFVLALVAVIVIGPKDLPRVLRTFGQFMAKARGMAREFQTHVDAAMKDAGVSELKKDIDAARGQVASVMSNTMPQAKAPAAMSAASSTGAMATPFVAVGPAADARAFSDYFGAEARPGETRVASRIVAADAAS